MTKRTAFRSESDSSGLLYNPKFRAFAYQAIVLLLVVALIWWLGSNASRNLAAQSKTTGFAFLDQTAGFSIGYTLIAFDRASSYFAVFIVGILNTLLVASLGVVLATFLGFIIGISRLSKNFIIRTLAGVYIEIFRNIPLLLQLIFWYFLAINAMPSVRDSIEIPGGIYINQRGINFPALITDTSFWIVAVVFVLTIIAAFIWRKLSIKHTILTGARRPIWLPMIAIVVVPTLIAFFLSGSQISFDYPELKGFNFRGGAVLPPELIALVFGLTIYTAAFIAEIVRAGILSVNYGQTEAAEALGLSDGDRLRLVIVPQAMRVIVPPLTSQYLNLTKNSSLGAAIGFPELVSVFTGTALNQSGRAVEIISLTMLVYLTISLSTSLFMNWYNSRVKLIER